MQHNFMDIVAQRRSIYHLGADVSASEQQIIDIVRQALRYVPSAFNGQTTRIVLLTKSHHAKLWSIVKESLLPYLTPERKERSYDKIDTEFAAGFGTILFYEDMAIVEEQKSAFPTYAERMDTWSEHTSAMHQFVIWTALAEIGVGASLQHYNPLIDTRVATEWAIPASWRLIAQMPFGRRLSMPAQREQHLPISERLRIYK